MKNKEIYQLRMEDFIPIIGLNNHIQRISNKIYEDSLLQSNENYPAKGFIRDAILMTYNVALFEAFGIGLNGLASLLFK